LGEFVSLAVINEKRSHAAAAAVAAAPFFPRALHEDIIVMALTGF